MGGNGVWRETRGTDEVRRERAAAEARLLGIEAGLAKCTVCGRAAKVETFGREGLGVWVGCDRSAECGRYIEIHTEGWSIEETAREWNRCNRGAFGMIRRAKRWFRERFGAEKRAERKARAKERAEDERERAKRRRMFGMEEARSEGKRRRFWRKGNK